MNRDQLLNGMRRYRIYRYCTPSISYSIISIFIHSSLKGVYESNPLHFFASVFQQPATLKRRKGFSLTQLSKSNFICHTDEPKLWLVNCFTNLQEQEGTSEQALICLLIESWSRVYWLLISYPIDGNMIKWKQLRENCSSSNLK